jgi:hypothetical protein
VFRGTGFCFRMSNSRRDNAPARGTTAQNSNDVEIQIAQELHHMSFFDRNNIQEEIHGATSLAPNPSPQEIDTSFLEMQIEIDRIHPQDKRGYMQALLMNSHYILRDRNFWIKFLRADLFEAKPAAARFTKHIDLLWEFFGVNALLRPLRLEDLGSPEQDHLRSGETQVLPSRDRAQRLVLFYQRSHVTLPMITEVSRSISVSQFHSLDFWWLISRCAKTNVGSYDSLIFQFWCPRIFVGFRCPLVLPCYGIILLIVFLSKRHEYTFTCTLSFPMMWSPRNMGSSL